MAISVDCGGCGRNYTVRDDAAGRKFKCKDCGAVVEVPAAAGDDDEFGGLGGDLEDGDADEGVGSLPPVRRKRRSGGGGAAADRIKAPAVCLMVMAVLSLIGLVANLAMGLMGIGMEFGPPVQPGHEAARIIGQVVGFLIIGSCNVVTLLGAIKMQKLESYSLARTGAIIAVIPCCSPCTILGIPFGIWALVVMGDPAVKSSFSS